MDHLLKAALIALTLAGTWVCVTVGYNAVRGEVERIDVGSLRGEIERVSRRSRSSELQVMILKAGEADRNKAIKDQGEIVKDLMIKVWRLERAQREQQHKVDVPEPMPAKPKADEMIPAPFPQIPIPVN